MPLAKENLDQVSRLLVTMAQRHETIYQLAQRLNSSASWRSPDGKLTIDLTDAEREQLETFIRQYVQEADVIAVTLRSHLDDKPKSGPDAL